MQGRIFVVVVITDFFVWFMCSFAALANIFRLIVLVNEVFTALCNCSHCCTRNFFAFIFQDFLMHKDFIVILCCKGTFCSYEILLLSTILKRWPYYTLHFLLVMFKTIKYMFRLFASYYRFIFPILALLLHNTTVHEL